MVTRRLRDPLRPLASQRVNEARSGKARGASRTYTAATKTAATRTVAAMPAVRLRITSSHGVRRFEVTRFERSVGGYEPASWLVVGFHNHPQSRSETRERRWKVIQDFFRRCIN